MSLSLREKSRKEILFISLYARKKILDQASVRLDGKIAADLLKSIDRMLKKNKIPKSAVLYDIKGKRLDNDSTSVRILITIVSALNN